MKRLSISLLILMSYVLCTDAQSIAISVDSAAYDIGVIGQKDTIVEHTFVFCNEGADTVFFRRVEPTCNYTVKEMTDDGVAPDMVGYLTVELDTHEMYGKFKKDIFLYGNMQTMKLSIIGERHALPTYEEEDYSKIPDVDTARSGKKGRKRSKK